MKRLDERIEPERYVTLPDEWPVPKNLSLLHVTSCKHFRKEGIRKGGYIGIDESLPFEEGKPCAFMRMRKGKPEFRLSRKLLPDFECIGRLALIVSFPLLEVNNAES